MKTNNISWEMYGNGVIIKRKKRSWFKRLFKKYPVWETIAEYIPVKSYNSAETNKAGNVLYFNRILSEQDLIVIINAIRPGTVNKTLDELEDSKYYLNVTAKEDINLLRASK